MGNVRLTYADSDGDGSVKSDTEIIEESNYYPFGLKHKGYDDVVSANVNSVASRFKYNGIELEESLGVDWYEMELRQYDPAIARWTAIDPVVHHEYSTYSAFDNNPASADMLSVQKHKIKPDSADMLSVPEYKIKSLLRQWFFWYLLNLF